VRDGKPLAWARIRAAFKLDVNEYQGYRSLQLIVEHLEQADVEASTAEPMSIS
jgi:single-stranded-DNA-specific exonuclease